MQLYRLAAHLALFYYAFLTSSASAHSRSRVHFRRKLHSQNLHPWIDSKVGLASVGKPQERETFSVIVWGATLWTRDDTEHHDGLFCILRYGMPKTAWDEKLLGTGRISNTSTPTARSPTWNLGTLVTGSDQTELSVRVFALDEPDLSLPELRGKQLPGKKRLLGEISMSIGTLLQASRNSIDGKASFKLPGGGHVRLTGSHGGVAPNFALADYAIPLSTTYEVAAPIAGQQAVRVEDMNGLGPMLVGTAPLPSALQGIFWVDSQASGSSLLSFGGPNNDGNGCSLGYITGEKNSYKIRAGGDRVIALSEPSGLEKIEEAGDKVYSFEFDSASSPTFAQMYLSFENLDIGLNDNWTASFMKSQMHLLPDGDAEFPGSLVWSRNVSFWGLGSVGHSRLLQVVDGAGEKIEPAWSKFVASAKDSATRNYPGWMFYKSVAPASSPWGIAVSEEVLQRVRLHVVLIMVGLLALFGGCCTACAFGCLRFHRTASSLFGVWQKDKRKDLPQSYWIH